MHLEKSDKKKNEPEDFYWPALDKKKDYLLSVRNFNQKITIIKIMIIC